MRKLDMVRCEINGAKTLVQIREISESRVKYEKLNQETQEVSREEFEEMMIND